MGVSGAARRSGLIAVAVVAALVLPQRAEASASPIHVVDIGWWTRGDATGTPPPEFSVEQGVDGLIAVAALRVDSGGGVIRSATLHLREVDGANQDLGRLQICRTVESWTADAGGPLTDAPDPTCPAEPVSPTRNSTGWTVDITGLLRGTAGSASLMVLPLANGLPGQLVSIPFEVGFDAAVVDGSVEVVAIAPSTAGPPTNAGAGSSPKLRPALPALAAPSSPLAPDAAALGAMPSYHDNASVTGSPDLGPVGPMGTQEPADSAGRLWRWGLWLRVVLVGAAAGVLAGGGRWLTTSGRFAWPLAFIR